jgi:hypothetical protein
MKAAMSPISERLTRVQRRATSKAKRRPTNTADRPNPMRQWRM